VGAAGGRGPPPPTPRRPASFCPRPPATTDTPASMHFKASSPMKARHGPPRAGTMIWANRAALGAGGRTGRVIHKRDEAPRIMYWTTDPLPSGDHRAGP